MSYTTTITTTIEETEEKQLMSSITFRGAVSSQWTGCHHHPSRLQMATLSPGASDRATRLTWTWPDCDRWWWWWEWLRGNGHQRRKRLMNGYGAIRQMFIPASRTGHRWRTRSVAAWIQATLRSKSDPSASEPSVEPDQLAMSVTGITHVFDIWESYLNSDLHRARLLLLFRFFLGLAITKSYICELNVCEVKHMFGRLTLMRTSHPESLTAAWRRLQSPSIATAAKFLSPTRASFLSLQSNFD